MEGSVTASINLNEYCVKENDLIVLFPGSIISIHQQIEKARLCFAGFSSKFINTANLIESTMEHYHTIIENPVLSLDEKRGDYFKDYFRLLAKFYEYEAPTIDPEIIKSILDSLLNWIGALYKKLSFNDQIINRSEKICKDLMTLVMRYYTRERHVSFYARELGISLQHLSMTVKQKTGKNVSDIISEVVMMDAKAKLKSSHITVQEISNSLNFPSVSFFGKYFKRRQGVGPQEYRKG
jgi:AraC-like DNA-binding protein